MAAVKANRLVLGVLIGGLACHGCSPADDAIPGRYMAIYPWGSDTLELRPDFTFSQVIEAGGATENATGTWELKRDGGDLRVLLHGCLYGRDSVRATLPAKSKIGVCDVVGKQRWGTLGLGWERASPWKRVDG